MELRKDGDWDRVENIMNNLNRELKDSQRIFLIKAGLYAEGRAKSHISSQDLGWTPLKPATIAKKIRAGHSTNILVATSTYFHNITSWTNGDDKGFVGVKRNVTHEGGDNVSEIARYLEFGTKMNNIPPRPLWKPVLEELADWAIRNNSPVHIFLEKMEKY